MGWHNGSSPLDAWHHHKKLTIVAMHKARDIKGFTGIDLHEERGETKIRHWRRSKTLIEFIKKNSTAPLACHRRKKKLKILKQESRKKRSFTIWKVLEIIIIKDSPHRTRVLVNNHFQAATKLRDNLVKSSRFMCPQMWHIMSILQSIEFKLFFLFIAKWIDADS